MTQPAAKAQEPSMEEILASIRRIIADDDPSRVPPGAASPPPAAPDVLAAPAPHVLAAPAPHETESAGPKAATATKTGEEIDSMLAQLQAVSRQAAPSRDEPPVEILDLSDEMAAPAAAPAPALRTIDGENDLVLEEGAADPPPPSAPAREPRRAEADERGLVSPATSAAVDSAFNTLAQTVPVQSSRTLEDLVREMLRPMLKTWLDDNLPGLVERLVRAEIERVSRGR
jgi:cell pole-organizing protein PopZ